ncbi:hypothetical protein EH165_11720 [Nakamurella antarctica]|uniref:HTH tetR-type domain-containing protein n=1 Tax=Nakamurella antarctica TaxID=1902245 RepID=A0A3G8ZPH2_9ACTN|nr:TetR/AcrR family transcriptional regulator [Nakamurella antarctica]AZI58705.1 hypothetical protein EH165_11720 [Nakamurella antarctica]
MGRREEVLDAAITVVARGGIRGLTHRAVDLQSAVPAGTTSNYFRTRADLTTATFGRLAELIEATISSVDAAPVSDIEGLIQALGFSMKMTLGPGITVAGAAAVMFTEAAIDPSLHASVVATNELWCGAMERLLRRAGITDDVERRARWLLSYANGLVVDQMAMNEMHFDPVAAMRAAIMGFGHPGDG